MAASPSAKVGGTTTATLLLASTLTVMAGATISPALPKIEEHFASVQNARLLVELLLTIPAAAIALTAGPAGWLADRVGGKRLLFAAILLYALAGSSGLWLDGIWSLLAGRIVLGVAVAGIMTAATGMIGDLFKGEARARLLGWQAAATAGGGLVFLLGGGALADLGWRGPFAVYALALALLPAVLLFLGPAVVQTTERKPRDDQASTPGIVIGAALLIFVMGAAFYMVPTKLPFRLIEIGAVGGLSAGAAVGATVVASGLASLAAGRVAAWLGRRGAIGAGLLLLGAGLAGIGLSPSYPLTLAALIVVGCGTGVVQPTVMALALDAAPEGRSAKVAGFMTAAMFCGQFASPFIAAPLESGFDLAAAYWIVGLACATAGLLVAMNRTATPARTRDEAAAR